MFTDVNDQARAMIADHDRIAVKLRREQEALAARASGAHRRTVRFPVPAWLKQAPFVLRAAR